MLDQSVRFFLYWGAGCGLSVGEGRDDLADVGICFGAGLAFAGPAAADDEERVAWGHEPWDHLSIWLLLLALVPRL